MGVLYIISYFMLQELEGASSRTREGKGDIRSS